MKRLFLATLATLILTLGALTQVGVAQTAPASTPSTAVPAVKDKVARGYALSALKVLKSESDTRLSEDQKLHTRIDGVSTPNLSGYASVGYVRKNFMTMPRTEIWTIYTLLNVYDESNAKKRVSYIDSELTKELETKLKKKINTYEFELREKILLDALSLKIGTLTTEMEKVRKLSDNAANKDDVRRLQDSVDALSKTVTALATVIELKPDGTSVRLDRQWTTMADTNARLDDEFVKSQDLADMKLINAEEAREIAEEEAGKKFAELRAEFGPHLFALAQSIRAMGQGLQGTTAKASRRPLSGLLGNDLRVQLRLGDEVGDSAATAKAAEKALAEFATPETDGD